MNTTKTKTKSNHYFSLMARVKKTKPKQMSTTLKTCGRGCAEGWDVRCCCERNCPSKNTVDQFLACPMRISTLWFTMQNDYALYLLIEKGGLETVNHLAREFGFSKEDAVLVCAKYIEVEAEKMSSPRSNDSSTVPDYVPPVVTGKCVKATYYPVEMFFNVPDHIDLEDKKQVVNYYVHRNILRIVLVDGGKIFLVEGMTFDTELKAPVTMEIVDRSDHPWMIIANSVGVKEARRDRIETEKSNHSTMKYWGVEPSSSGSESAGSPVASPRKPVTTKKAQARRQIPIESSSSSSSSSSEPIYDDEQREKQKAFDEECRVDFLSDSIVDVISVKMNSKM